MTRQKTTEEEERTANTGLAKVAVQCSISTFVVKIATFAKPEKGGTYRALIKND